MRKDSLTEALNPKFNNEPCFTEALWDGRSTTRAVRGVCQLACNIFLILGPERTIYIVVLFPLPPQHKAVTILDVQLCLLS